MDKFFASPWMRILLVLGCLAAIVFGFLYFKEKKETQPVQAQATLPAPLVPSGAKKETLPSPPAALPNEQLLKDFAVTNLVATPSPAVHREPIQEKENLLANPGFEEGTQPWVWLNWSKGWSAFEHSSAQAYEGKSSLLLPLLSVDARPTVVWGGVQELTLAGEMPECVEGYYYVENWTKGDWKQYLQVVLIDLTHSLGPNRGQAQLRYIVSGEQSAPLTISNAQYLFVETERRVHPVIGEWTKFSMNPRQDFVKNWNYVPGAGDKIRALFEARFDAHGPTQTQARAKVYYDNLYIGPKSDTRCVP